jgi:hypothetical protein
MSTTWISIEVKAKTTWPNGKTKAVLVSNGKQEAWLPYSQIVDMGEELEVGVETSIEISERTAEEKELV